VCTQCRQCLPAGSRACPRCGIASAAADRPEQAAAEETSRARWSVAMLVEMVGKAILQNNSGDAEKLMRRTALVVGDELRAGRPLSPDELRALEEAACWIDRSRGDTAWSSWCGHLRVR
jgi:hypothetical protein